MNITELNQFDLQDVQECHLSLSMDLSEIIRDDETSENKYKIIEGARIDLHLHSPECHMDFRASLYQDKTDYDRKTINYSILLILVAITNLYFIAKMIRTCAGSPAQANKVNFH